MKYFKTRWPSIVLLVLFFIYFAFIQRFVLAVISILLAGFILKKNDLARKFAIGFFIFIAIGLVFVFFPMNVENEGTLFYEMDLYLKLPLLAFVEACLFAVILTIKNKLVEDVPS